MTRFQKMAFIAVLLGASALAGCGGGYYSAGVVVGPPPPAPYVGPVGYAPGQSFVWIDGFYDLRGGRWVWVNGYWRRPPRPGAVWVKPYWERRDERHWRYHRGYWQR